MRGVVSIAGYVPYRRLDRTEIGNFLGSGGGKGTRAVASFDEDTTTMGVEASRLALRSLPGAAPESLWFATAYPAYADKTNATAIHSALRLPPNVAAYDFGGALRSGMGALATAFRTTGPTLVVSADRRDGLPTGTDETFGGDGASAVLIGDDTPTTPVLAEYLGGAAATDEFVDRWRAPGESRSRAWEERFGETRYLALGMDAWHRALQTAGVTAKDIDQVIVTGMHSRAGRVLGAKLATQTITLANDLSADVGQTGTAHPALVLANLLETEASNLHMGAGASAGTEVRTPGRVIVLLHLADGADALVLRTTPAFAEWHPARTLRAQIANGAPITYGKFLSWRGMLTLEPPRRPEPSRVSSTAAWRNEEWKFGFVGSRDRTSGAIHMPPSRVSMLGGTFDDMEDRPMADVMGTVVTFTEDRMAYSPNPPIIFAIVDFDNGGRFPVELTDLNAGSIGIGDRVEMTFRRLFSADGIHDYFWKARPLREAGAAGTKEGNE